MHHTSDRRAQVIRPWERASSSDCFGRRPATPSRWTRISQVVEQLVATPEGQRLVPPNFLQRLGNPSRSGGGMNREEFAEALPRLPECLDLLKDFQRQTVEYVFRRMYTDPNPTTRFSGG